jgi:2-amino-4-hydroxy-6-hydroxymethyldihydropteridine diphosphokinase
VTAYVALGANLGDPLATLRTAVRELAALGRVTAASAVYRTAPIGPVAQPDYLNAVVALDTELSPEEVLRGLLAIEARHGRVRAARWGPRTLDLDLIAQGDERRDRPGLVLPHRRAHLREFVLRPLADVAPDLVLAGRPVRELLAALPPQGVTRLADRLEPRPLGPARDA